ncbi:MAG: hypothetical protein RDA78_01625 [Roseibium sp.]|uniref:hypothetical protein n=1 Tax=Roseibium sp. TaxID=1936156 RepID=UPI003D9C11FA
MMRIFPQSSVQNILLMATSCLILFMFFAGKPHAQAWEEACTVTSQRLNVRAAPGTHNPVIAQLLGGTNVVWWRSEYDLDGDVWHRFPLNNGRHGFASAKHFRCNFRLTPDLVDAASTIALIGEIRSGYSEMVRRKLDAVGPNALIILESGGGLVIEAMKAGDHIRRNGATITVNGRCASACLFVLAGGMERFTNSVALLGLHRAFLPDRELTDFERQENLNRQRRYLSQMGVDPVFADIADAHPGDLIWFDHHELFKWGFLTEIIRD